MDSGPCHTYCPVTDIRRSHVEYKRQTPSLKEGN